MDITRLNTDNSRLVTELKNSQKENYRINDDLLQFIIIDGDQISYVRGKRVANSMSKKIITADPVSDIRRIAQVMQESISLVFLLSMNRTV